MIFSLLLNIFITKNEMREYGKVTVVFFLIFFFFRAARAQERPLKKGAGENRCCNLNSDSVFDDCPLLTHFLFSRQSFSLREGGLSFFSWVAEVEEGGGGMMHLGLTNYFSVYEMFLFLLPQARWFSCPFVALALLFLALLLVGAPRRRHRPAGVEAAVRELLLVRGLQGERGFRIAVPGQDH